MMGQYFQQEQKQKQHWSILFSPVEMLLLNNGVPKGEENRS
jgi:hypothetical protein